MKLTTAEDVFAAVGQGELLPFTVCLLGADNVVVPGETCEVHFERLRNMDSLKRVLVDGKEMNAGYRSFEFKCPKKQQPGYLPVTFEWNMERDTTSYSKVAVPDSEVTIPSGPQRIYEQTIHDILRVVDTKDSKVLEFFVRTPKADEIEALQVVEELSDLKEKVEKGEVELPVLLDESIGDDLIIDDGLHEVDNEVADLRSKSQYLTTAVDYINGVLGQQLSDLKQFEKTYFKIRDRNLRVNVHAIVTLVRNENGDRIFSADDAVKIMEKFDHKVLGNLGSLLWRVANPTTVESMIKN